MTKKLKENKKIVFPCMLCSPTQEYKKKYEDMNYKVICHNGIQKNNDVLKNYKNEWSSMIFFYIVQLLKQGWIMINNILIIIWGISLKAD